MFFGRKGELAELERRLRNDRFEFGVIYGSRRIGKSSLIEEFIKGKNGFRYQARQGTEEENLRIFSREFNRFRGMDEEMKFESFEAALDSVAKYASTERFIFVIDEVSYLCAKGKRLLSSLQYYVDGVFRESNMLFLLSGSNISFMKEILNNRNDPLYKRTTFEINLRKLPFSEALPFLTHCPREEKADYLSLFGTFPYYLNMIDPCDSFDENVRHLLYSPYGTLLDAPEKVLPSGAADQNTFTTILRAISLSKRSSKEIADYVGVTPNYLAPYLSALTEMQILERREAFTRNRKMNYYEISDNLLRFWYRFIYEKADQISMGIGDTLFLAQRGQIRTFLAHGFEDLTIDYLTEENVRGNLPHIYGAILNYHVDNSQLGRSIELDGLAESVEDGGKSLLAIECKDRKSTMTMSVLRHLEENVSIFQGYEHVDYFLVSKSDFTDDLLSCGRSDVHLITLDDMLGNVSDR